MLVGLKAGVIFQNSFTAGSHPYSNRAQQSTIHYTAERGVQKVFLADFLAVEF